MNRILIAEDEPRIATLLEKGLQTQGFTTTISGDSQEAVNLAKSINFQLLLLDLDLPSKDGWTVLKKLRHQGKKLPVIILTARSDANDKVSGFASGANDYMTKPFCFKELLARIRAQLQSNLLPLNEGV